MCCHGQSFGPVHGEEGRPGLILSVETNTFVESMKQKVEFKKRICGVHDIVHKQNVEFKKRICGVHE